MEYLVVRLNVSQLVTVVLTEPNDIANYDALLNVMYRDFLGQVKINHIFLCSGDILLAMTLEMRKSNLLEHTALTHIASKVRSRKFNCPAEVWAHSEAKLMVLKCIGLNP